MDVVFVVVLVALSLSAGCALYRIIRGPSILDRMVASDVLLVTVICALLVDMAYRRHTDTLPVVLVLAMLGFVGAVGVARFVSNEAPES